MCSKITRQNHVGGQTQFKLPAENPPKQPWRGITSADNTRFTAKAVLAGNLATIAACGMDNHAGKPQRRAVTFFETALLRGSYA